MKSLIWLAVSLFLIPLRPLAAQQAHPRGKIILVTPFENASKVPGLDWIGEAFPEVLGQRLAAENWFVVSRTDRNYAFDHLGIPPHVHPSRATLFRIAQEMDVDYVVLGSYQYDGRSFTARAQLLQVEKLRLLPETVESGALTQLVELQNALAWSLLHALDPMFNRSRNDYVARSAPVRLDALENYIRGVTSTTNEEKLKYFREATRVSPDYPEGLLQLGKTYIELKQYEAAAAALSRIGAQQPGANEAQFFLGLADYYSGKFDRAEEVFSTLARQLPLIEVYNNLGAATARLGKKSALQYFRQASEADSQDPDYHFNLSIELARAGNMQEALRQVKESLALRPQDTEVRTFHDQLASGSPVTRLPAERVKRNYDETSYRQLAMEIQNAAERRFSSLPPRQHAEAHVRRGTAMLQQGMLQQAETEFREAVLLAPDNAAAHGGLAEALEAEGELTEAGNEAMMANRLSLSAEAFLVLARIEYRQSRTENAQDYLKRALTLEPENQAVLRFKKELDEKK